MSYKKFNKQVSGKYYTNYFKRDTLFYAAIQKHISKAIRRENSIGIDIGAGPGIGAILCSSLRLNTTLIGYEPSKTSLDGKRLSLRLEGSHDSVQYSSVHKGIKEIATPKKDSLDYILILRAAHEIADTLGSKRKFFSEIKRISKGLKKSGVLIIADAEYAEPFHSHPEKYAAVIDAVRAYQEKHIGHSHKPSDYFTHQEMKKNMSSSGFVMLKETIIPNQDLYHSLNKEGIAFKKSPLSFYVQTYRKR